MTDLQRLARWHDRHSKAWPEQSAHAKKYAETARILALLLRVREGCEIHGPHVATSKHSRVAIVGDHNLARDLAKLLGGSSA